mgnify:CR=1 FL=1
MNCFQIVILHRCFTSYRSCQSPLLSLWIAFKLLSYIGVSQGSNPSPFRQARCELLSNCYLTSVFHKFGINISGPRCVVNCFQIVILHRCFTSLGVAIIALNALWIAFKLLSYIGVSQAQGVGYSHRICCELLSNCYLTSVFHKSIDSTKGTENVVNCFQIVILHRCFTR